MAVTVVLTGTTQSVTATNGLNTILVASTTGWVVGATMDGTGWAAGTKIVSFVANTSAVVSNNFTGTTGATNVIVSSNTGTVTVTLAASGDTASPQNIINAGYGTLVGNITMQVFGACKIYLQIATGAVYDDTEWTYELGNGSSLRMNETYGCGIWRSGWVLNGTGYVKAKGHTVNYNNYDNSSGVGGRSIFYNSGAPAGYVAGTTMPSVHWNDVGWFEYNGSNGAAIPTMYYGSWSPVGLTSGRIVMDYKNDGAGANSGFGGSYGTIESMLLYKCIGGVSVGVTATQVVTVQKFEYFSLPTSGGGSNPDIKMAFPSNVVFSGFAPIFYTSPTSNEYVGCNTTNTEILLDPVLPTGYDLTVQCRNYSNGTRQWQRTVALTFKDSTGTALTNTTAYIYSGSNVLVNAVQSGNFSQGVQSVYLKWGGPFNSYRPASLVVDTRSQTVQVRKNGYVQQSLTYSLQDSAYSNTFFMLTDSAYGSVTPTAAAALTGITPDYSNNILEISSTHNLDEVYAYGGYSLALPANSQYANYQQSSGGAYSLISPWAMHIIAGALTMGTYNSKINGSKQFLVQGNTVAHCTSGALWGTSANYWNAGETWGTYVTYGAATSVTLNKVDSVWTPGSRADMWQIASGATLNMTNGATLTFNPTAGLGYGTATTSEFRSGSTVNISNSTVTYNIVSGGSGTVFSNTEAGSTWNISNSTLTLNCPNGAQVAVHAYFLPASVITNFTVNGTASNVVWQMGYTSNNSKMTGFTYGGAIFGNGSSNILMDKYTYTGALTTIPNTFGAGNKWWWVDPVMSAGGLFRWAAGSTSTGVSGFYGVIGFRPTITMDKTGYTPRARFTPSTLASRYPSFQTATTAFTAIPLSNFFRDPTFMSASDGFLPFVDGLDDKTVLNTIDWTANFRQAGWLDQTVVYTAATAKYGTIVSTISGAVDANYVNATTALADSALITVNTSTNTIAAGTGTLTWSPQRLYNALKNWWATYASDTDFLASTGSGYLDLGNYNVASSIIFGATATGDALIQVRTTGTVNNAQNAVPITANVLQATPTNLTGVTINGNLTFNTNTNTTITLTNCTITGTIKNTGTGIVTITNSGSTLGTIGVNVTTRLYALFTASGLLATSTVAVFDQYGNQIDVTTNSGTTYTYDATGGIGTWSWAIEYYGKQRQTGTFTPSTGATTVIASYTTDLYITQTTKATVAAYTDLTNDDMVYDYAAYMRTQQPKYVFATRSSTDIDWGSTNVAYSSTASSVWAYTYVDNGLFVGGVLQAAGVLGSTTLLNGTPLLTIKSSAMADGAYFKRQKTTGTMTFTGTTINTLYQNNVGPNTRFYFSGVQSNSSVLLVDNSAVERLFVQNTSASTYTYYIEPGASGTWIAKIRNYSNNATDVTFTPPGGNYFIGSDNVPDTYVVDTYANTSAYTNLETTQKVYDYSKYFSTTHTGIYFGKLFTKGFGTLTANLEYNTDPSATDVMAADSGQVTSKTSGFAETVTILVNGNFRQHTATLSNSVQIRANNLDSELVYSGIDNITVYPTLNDAMAGTNAGATSNNGILRFLYGASLSGVVMTGTIYLRTVIGSVNEIQSITLVQGHNVLDLSTTVLLQSIINSVANVPTAVLAATVESTYSVGDSLRLANSVLGGKTSGAQSGVETFRDLGDTKDRLVSTVDTKGNRSVEAYNLGQ